MQTTQQLVCHKAAPTAAMPTTSLRHTTTNHSRICLRLVKSKGMNGIFALGDTLWPLHGQNIQPKHPTIQCDNGRPTYENGILAKPLEGGSKCDARKNSRKLQCREIEDFSIIQGRFSTLITSGLGEQS